MNYIKSLEKTANFRNIKRFDLKVVLEIMLKGCKFKNEEELAYGKAFSLIYSVSKGPLFT